MQASTLAFVTFTMKRQNLEWSSRYHHHQRHRNHSIVEGQLTMGHVQVSHMVYGNFLYTQR